MHAALCVASMSAACSERPAGATLDDALRAYDAGRFADALRAGTAVRTSSSDPASAARDSATSAADRPRASASKSRPTARLRA